MLNPDFKEMLSCLKDEAVDFISVGAYALAVHGFPRATGEIDIWVRNSSENAQKIIRAPTKFGAPISRLSEEDFTAPDMIVQLGVEPCRIDLLTSIDGVGFDEAWQNKVGITIDDLKIDVLSKEDLLRNKRASGRDKDQGDIAWLEKTQGSKAWQFSEPNSGRPSNMTEDENRVVQNITEQSEGMSEAEIDANLMDSFPASDPPSWTLGINHREETQVEESKSGDEDQAK
jgi:hypothetical protein